MKTATRTAGFTLIELMVTLAVAAVLLAWGVPNFRDFVADNRLATTTNDLVTAFAYARSEAVRRGALIEVRADAAGWSGGWQVVDPARPDEPLRVFRPAATDITITADDGALAVTIDNRGLLQRGAALVLTLCDGRSGETGRQLRLLPTGRAVLDREFQGCI